MIAACTPSKPGPPAPQGVPGRFAPGQLAAIDVPLRFVITGLFSLWLGVAAIWYRPDILATYHYNQYVIAVTHLFVLGFVCSIVMGALYQLVPVALETPLHSVRLARWQYPFHLVGFAGMVWMFWKWDMKRVGHFGSVFAVGVGMFVYNIARTLLRAPRRSVVALSVGSSLFWLSAAVFAGLAIAAGKCTYESAETVAPTSFLGAMIHGLKQLGRFATRFDQIGAMHAHAHLGAVGVFLMLIVGVSYKLVPMFALSEVQNGRRAGLSILLLNLGLAGSFLAILLRSPWRPAAALLLAGGLVLYGIEMRAIVAARKRRVIDWGLRSFLTAIGLLAPLSILGLILSWPGLPLNSLTGQVENVYGFLALLGVIAFAITGMLYKIVPFLTWYRTYSPLIGARKIPSLADLYSPRLQAGGYWSYICGLLVVVGGILASSGTWVRLGAMILLVSLGLLVWNMGLILRHWRRPRLEAPAPPADKPQPTARVSPTSSRLALSKP